MGTTAAPWTVAELVAAKDGSGNKKISVPTFQRSLEWTDAQKMKLVASLVRGHPIGALILYHDEVATARNGKTTYLVVDGLQRLNALAWYGQEELARFSLDALPELALNDLREAVVRLGSAEDSSEVDDALQDWLKGLKKVSPEFDASTLIDQLQQDFDFKADKATGDACRSVVQKIRDLVAISEIHVPVLEYSGAKASLAEVFRDINTSGTQLSQYDILNALWTDEATSIADSDIRDAIAKRYETVEAAGFTLEEKFEKEYNLYEYLLGLGKYLLGDTKVKDVGFLASRAKRDDQADAIVFSIAAVTHGLRSSELGDVPLRMERDASEVIQPAGFQDAAVAALKWVADTLRPYLDYDFKGSRGAVPHTQLQIASIVARVMLGMYTPGTWKRRPEWRREQRILKKNIPRYYVLDIMKNNWAGAGDSRLFNMVWDAKSKPSKWETRALSNHYLQPIPDDQLADALRSYFEDSKRVQDTKRRGASAVDRLILKLAYLDKLKIKDLHDKWEIEHLMPVALLQTLLKKDKTHDGWPINSVANLAALDKKINRSKQDQTVAEYVKSKPKDAKRVEGYVFMPVAEVKHPYSAGSKTDFDDYIRFLDDNFAHMRAHVIRNLP